jgi:DNA-binding response OmpR family regulator
LGRILVIDDEAGVRSLLAEILSTQGHTVDQTSDGSEGLALLEHNRYDLVITDLGMPEVTGWEVARVVKARWPSSRVILVTGWGESVKREATAEQGVDALLCKPFKVQEVRSLVATLLEGAAEDR